MASIKHHRVVMTCLLLITISFVGYAQQKVASNKSNYDYVNPFIGTQEMGHTFPGACVPFGMVQLSPETDTVEYFDNGKYNPNVYRYCAGYQYADRTIVGFSHTHFSGTGHSDLGDFLIMPTTGQLQLSPGTAAHPERGYRSPFSHNEESASPGYYRVRLHKYNINAELTATTRVGFHQYTFPQTDSAHIILDMNYSLYNYPGKVLWSYVRVENDTLVTGYRITQGWARTRYLHFAMSFSKPFKGYGYKNDEEPSYKGFWRKFNQYDNFPEMAGKNIKAYFDFSTHQNEKIKIKLAISSVSTEGALKNLRSEIPHWNFETIRSDARTLWGKELDNVSITAPDSTKTSFYTSLYHAYISPITYSDIDGNYRGLDNNIHTADKYTNYTIFSLWDTYRALHPLFTILQPKRVSDMVQSMLDHYDQSAHKLLPIWTHDGNENWCMIGYHSVPVIADAYLKGIRDYDVKKAFEACVATATHESFQGIGDYVRYGYAPLDKLSNSASITLEYAYDDFTVAQFAKAMNKPDIEKQFMQRAMSYRNIFDPSTGFMRAKDSKGNWQTPMDPLSTEGQGFIEGNGWNYSFYVPQDVNGYSKLLGGDNVLVRKLDSLFNMQLDEKYFESTEDVTRAGLIGSYDQGNEPSHHICYMYDWTGQPWKTQEKIHLVMNKMYRSLPDGLCGNDDCGQMSAWYIFSALGFYPVCPGTNQYVIGSPCVREAKLALQNNKTFVVKAMNLSGKNIYIQSVTLNGKQLNKTYIMHNEIVDGGELVFTMGNKPNKEWGVAQDDKPYSISNK
ncbi:MAG: glycoside hydrolase family 92 protein [Ignavibacteria bacterium]|nr:glycoside hydrolase family 92 protein [Ignavibacteria bacterium]